jgi:hypothetical protein
MIDQTPESILVEIDRLSGGNLHYRDDLERLIEIAITKNKMAELEKISFSAKFLNGLVNVVKKKSDSADEQFFIKAQKEYKDNLKLIIVLLNEFVSHGTNFYKSIFEEKYLKMNQLSIENLNFLFSDLAFLKLYFNDNRHEKT